MRGSKIDHMPGEHDDWINSTAIALYVATEVKQEGEPVLMGHMESTSDPFLYMNI